MTRRTRVLFFAEAVTLAHVSRPARLAEALPEDRYEVHFACAPGYDAILPQSLASLVRIESIPAERFLRALSKGTPLYDYRTLVRYVQEDLRVIDAVAPDLIVGDFRLSLAVSAPLRGVPYAALANAHWSPYAVDRDAPLPELPVVRFLGERLASPVFRAVQPLAFALHARALNRLREKHGLAPVGDLRAVYTHGDYTLYLDLPSLIPIANAPANHRYLGPLIWSPRMTLPDWWASVPSDRPWVYVTLGSSGAADRLGSILEGLAGLGGAVLVATAGRTEVPRRLENVWSAPFLPGSEVVSRCALVVSNGGSATTYQALAAGVPVLGVPSNMDQFFTQGAVVRAGAGALMRPSVVRPVRFRELALELLKDPAYTTAAKRLAREIAEFSAPARFLGFAEEVCRRTVH